MECFVFLWALLVAGWAVWRLLAYGARRAAAAAAATRQRAEERRQRQEKERQDQEAAERRQADEERQRRKDAERRRRVNARARADALYLLHAPEIGKRFTRPMFDDYVRKYMGDDLAPEEVEARASLLEGLLLEHVERVQPAPKFRSLEDIARWFEEQKTQLNGLPDDRVRQTLLAKLKARYTELTSEFLEEMRA